jgi:hypothetical protein
MMAARTTTIWLVTLLATAALAQSPSIGSEPPKLHGQTLDEKNIVLPDETGGKVTLLVVSLSRKAGERSGSWREHFAADFASDPHVTYYVAAMLQGAPSFIRGMIRSGIRKGTPEAAQSHVLTSATDEAAWKLYLQMQDDSLPAVLLLDPNGHLRWSYDGVFDPDHYRDLKAATVTARDRR